MPKTYKEIINESSLSRIWAKTRDHDAGAMSAFRGSLTRAENRQNNKKLLAYLMRKGYSVTKVKGSYLEDFGTKKEKEVGEESFFVADHKNTGNLKADLLKLGRLYDQDSILWVPHGGKAVLIGTNNAEFPGFNNEVPVGNARFGFAKGQFFSRVRGRKFAFEEVESVTEMTEPDTINGKWAMSKLAEQVENELKTVSDE